MNLIPGVSYQNKTKISAPLNIKAIHIIIDPAADAFANPPIGPKIENSFFCRDSNSSSIAL